MVNASNIEKDWNHISFYNDEFKADIKNISERYSLLAIQDPKAFEAMQSLTSVNLADIKFYHFEVADIAAIDNVIIATTGYNGSGGFEIYCKNDEVNKYWTPLLKPEQISELNQSDWQLEIPLV